MNQNEELKEINPTPLNLFLTIFPNPSLFEKKLVEKAICRKRNDTILIR